MILFFIALLLVSLYGITFQRKGEFDGAYLAKEHTTAINGFFIGWVFLRHVCDPLMSAGYDTGGISDKLFSIIDGGASQLIVVMFLFGSGYGVMSSILKKGESYIETFPRKRILKVLLDFDIAVVLYWAVQLAMGRVPDWSSTLLALTGWSAIGNSNWYIFDILLCYACVWISFKCLPRIKLEWSTTGMLLLGVLLLSFFKGYWWYDTLLIFGIGMIYASHKVKIESFLQKHWWVNLMIGILGFGLCRYLASFTYVAFVNGLILNVAHGFITLVMVMLMMKVKVGNPIMNWLGTNLFPIYIYQRLAMMIVVALAGKSLVAVHPYLFVMVAFALTAAFAWAYQKLLRIKL